MDRLPTLETKSRAALTFYVFQTEILAVNALVAVRPWTKFHVRISLNILFSEIFGVLLQFARRVFQQLQDQTVPDRCLAAHKHAIKEHYFGVHGCQDELLPTIDTKLVPTAKLQESVTLFIAHSTHLNYLLEAIRLLLIVYEGMHLLYPLQKHVLTPLCIPPTTVQQEDAPVRPNV